MNPRGSEPASPLVWEVISPFRAGADSRAQRLVARLRERQVPANLVSTADAVGEGGHRLLRRIKGYQVAWRAARKARIVVAVNCEYAIIATLAKWLNRLRGQKGPTVIADIYDHHGYIFPIPIAWLFHLVERLAIVFADWAIIPIPAREQQYYPALSSRELGRIVHISNLGFQYLDDSHSLESAASQGVLGKARLVYAGTLDRGRGLVAAAMAADLHPDEIEVSMYGGGPLLRDEKVFPVLQPVFKGLFVSEGLSKIYRGADAMLACYELSVPNHKFCDPNKLREVVEYGIPAITNGGTPFAADIADLQLGVVLDQVSPERICHALEEVRAKSAEWPGLFERSRFRLKERIDRNRSELDSLLAVVSAGEG